MSPFMSCFQTGTELWSRKTSRKWNVHVDGVSYVWRTEKLSIVKYLRMKKIHVRRHRRICHLVKTTGFQSLWWEAPTLVSKQRVLCFLQWNLNLMSCLLHALRRRHPLLESSRHFLVVNESHPAAFFICKKANSLKCPQTISLDISRSSRLKMPFSLKDDTGEVQACSKLGMLSVSGEFYTVGSSKFF